MIRIAKGMPVFLAGFCLGLLVMGIAADHKYADRARVPHWGEIQPAPSELDYCGNLPPVYGSDC